MRKLLLSLLLLLFLFVKPSFAQENGWTIENFNSNINVSTNGEISVDETISVDFKGLEKHGIYRDLPYVYNEEGNLRYTDLNVIEVLQDGRNATTEITKNDSNLRIRIGDANKTIKGKHTYEIRYKVLGILKGFEDHDELYWNVTGNEWEAPILSTTASVTTPVPAITETTCFEGILGSTKNCSNEIVDDKSAKFFSSGILNPGEGLTIVSGFKKGIFDIVTVEKPPTLLEQIKSRNSIITFLAALALGLFIVGYQWFKKGRDSWFRGISGYVDKNAKPEVKPIGSHESVVVEYTPPEKLTPALMGVIIDEKADTLDVTSSIIDLASKGYLKITETPKKWIFGKVDFILKQTNKDKSKLLKYEKELLSGIFTTKEVKMSELKNKFYTTLAKVKKEIYKESLDKNLFFSDPERTRTIYLVIGIVAMTISFSALIISIVNQLVFLFDISSAGLVSSVVLIVFSRFMPRRTAYGRELYRRIQGYKLFIETAEKHRQRFFEDKNLFNEVLPYAIVFGLTKKFAKAMDKIGVKPSSPTWYHGIGAFSAANFTNEVSSFSDSLSTAIASTPSSSGFSSGGGFSGGGGGGGGGGSW